MKIVAQVISISLTPIQVKGIKNYLKDVCDIENPTAKDVENEMRRRFEACMDDTRESLHNFIEAEELRAVEQFHNRPN